MSQTETRPPLEALPLQVLETMVGLLKLAQAQLDSAAPTFSAPTFAPYVQPHTRRAIADAALALGWAAEVLEADIRNAGLPRYG